MVKLAGPTALRAHLPKNALTHASRFTWQRTAEQTLTVYQRVARQATPSEDEGYERIRNYLQVCPVLDVRAMNRSNAGVC